MNRLQDDLDPQRPEPEARPSDDDETPWRWLLGCLGKTLLVFVIVVLLVFGACFVLLVR